MNRSLQITVSLISAAVIAFGLLYIRKREALHEVNLQAAYRETNERYFENKLTDVSVSWEDLSSIHAAGLAHRT